MDRIKILRLQSKVKYYMYMYVHRQTDFANSYILHLQELQSKHGNFFQWQPREFKTSCLQATLP